MMILALTLAFLSVMIACSGVLLPVIRARDPLTLTCLPILGGLLIGAVPLVLLMHTSLSFSALLGGVGAAAMAGALLWLIELRRLRGPDPGSLRTGTIGAIVLVLLVVGPFMAHGVPPDVDGQFSTTMAAYQLMGDRYPFFGVSGPEQSPLKLLLPEGTSVMLALAASLDPDRLALFALAQACAWTLLAIAVFVPLAREIAPELRIELVLLAVIVFAVTRTMILNYGGGSYNRLPGIAALVAVCALPGLVTRGRTGDAILLGVLLLGTIGYFHQRYAILLTHIYLVLFLLLALCEPRARRGDLSKVVAGILVGTVLFYLPVAGDILTLSGQMAEGTPMGNPEYERGLREIYEGFLLPFQGLAIWIATLAGALWCLWRPPETPARWAAFASLIVFAAFVIPAVMLTLNPLVVPFAYARVVALMPVALVKGFFGLTLFAALVSALEGRFTGARARFGGLATGAAGVAVLAIWTVAALNEAAFFRLAVDAVMARAPALAVAALALGALAVIGTAMVFLRGLPRSPGGIALAFIGSMALLIASAHALGPVMLPEAPFTARVENALPTPFTHNAVTIGAVTAAAAVLLMTALRGIAVGAALPVLALLGLWVADLRGARFSLPFGSDGIRAAAVWLGSNTEQTGTLVFSPCNVEPYGLDATAWIPADRVERYQPKFATDWLSVLSLRRTVCNRVHLVGSKSRIFGRALTRPDDWEAMHRAYWRLDAPGAATVFRRNGVTHLLTGHQTDRVYGGTVAPAGGFERVFEHPGPFGYTLWRVLPQGG